jgi:site-specific DNA recombinase
MKAVGYVRVSTEEQTLMGVSLDAQEEKIKAYCIAKEWDLIRVARDEGYSAKGLNYPRIQEIITGCKRKEFDVVVILKLDRLTRSVKDSERTRNGMQFMKKDLKLVGEVPFGYDCNNGELSQNPEESLIAQKMLALRKRGRSYQKIAAHLNAKEIPSKNGGKWHPKTVMGIIKAFPAYPSHYQGDI